MTIEVDVQLAASHIPCPSETDIKHWIVNSLNKLETQGNIVVRIVSEQEIQQLNHLYRKKNTPTNVLSFPCQLPLEFRENMLGDIVICAKVLEKEAKDQHKSLQAHWAHMLIHGTLHLLGYDHENHDEALQMESLEIMLLQALGFSDPYAMEKTYE